VLACKKALHFRTIVNYLSISIHRSRSLSFESTTSEPKRHEHDGEQYRCVALHIHQIWLGSLCVCYCITCNGKCAILYLAWFPGNNVQHSRRRVESLRYKSELTIIFIIMSLSFNKSFSCIRQSCVRNCTASHFACLFNFLQLRSCAELALQCALSGCVVF
jgi:hypothetical protein